MLINNNSYKDKPQELSWESVFALNEFQQYLAFNEIIKISLISKFVRNKLVNNIFKTIELTYTNLLQLPNFFEFKLLNCASDLSGLDFKSSRIDPFVNELTCEIRKFSVYFNSLKFTNLYEAGYYITPLTLHFTQLASLKISNCTIGLKKFKELMLSLNKLECLVLFKLNFVKFPDEGPIERDILLPETLKELSISQLQISTTSIPVSPIEFLLNSDSILSRDEFYLPLQPLRNLKKLKLRSNINDLQFINDFLALNPQLSDFRTSSENINLESIGVISYNNSIKHLEINSYKSVKISPDLSLPLLDSLKSLVIPSIEKSQYPSLYQLAEACTSLTKLDIAIYNYDIDFITNTLKKLNRLKSFKLKIDKLSRKELDFALYSNIESLKICFRTNRTITYKLPYQPIKLTSLSIFTGKQYKENFDSICEASKNYSNWKVKLVGKQISCRLEIN